ncbi:MAG: tetratricopeptide repeat protein [Vicinamibacteraceae bacterium]
MWGVALALLAAGQPCQSLLSLARQAYEGRQYREASALFTSALSECGATESLLLGLAQSQLLAQDVTGALETLDRLLALNATSVPTLKVRAKALYLAARDREAEDTLHAAAKQAPDDAEIPYDLGRIYYQQGRHQEAAGAFRRAIVLDSRAYKAWDNLGLTLEALGDPARATGHYLEAMEIAQTDQPRYDVVYANYADLLIKQGEHRKAFDAGAEAAQRNPNDPRNFFLTGKALVKLGRPDVSLKWLAQATALDPDYAAAHYLLSQAYRRLGRLDDATRALKAFEAASARAPKERRE